MLLKQLHEQTKLTIDDLLTKEEQKRLEDIVKRGKSTRHFEDIASLRIREKGLNVPLNIHVYLKHLNQLKQHYRPEVYNKKLSPQTAEEIARERKYWLEQRRKRGLDPYTGD